MDQYENMNFDDVLASGEVDPDEIALLEAEEDPYGNTGVVPKTEEEINDYMYRNRKLIHAVLRPYRGLDDYDDLFQEASLGFLKGIRTYNEKKGIKLTTYAFACAKNQVKMYLRRGRAKSRTGTVLSLDASMDRSGLDERDTLLNRDLASLDPLAEPVDLDDQIQDRILFDAALKMMKECLNETQQFILMQFMKGVPQHKTATILHTSQSEISKIQKTSLCIISMRMTEGGYSRD